VVRQQRDLDVSRPSWSRRSRRLEGAADTEARNAVRRSCGHPFSVQEHLPASGRELAVQQVEAGRLARAVRPDERDHLAGGGRRTTPARARTPP